MNIIPNPQKFENISGSFEILDNSKIFCDEAFVSQAERFRTLVNESCGFLLQFTNVIEEAQIIFSCDSESEQEAYVIMIAQGVATVTCSSVVGCFYAVETLRQIFNLNVKQEQISCANCYVKDSPRFAYRGLLVDVCRHFFDVDTLKQIVELMSEVKLNKLHLHLTDDQGFRLQIDKYPFLHQISSQRGGSEVVKDGKRYVDDVQHGGYYTKQEIRDLVAYAAERNVEIIPEIDLPGHFVAALAAYPEYSCTHQVSEVRKTWGISKDILCAGNEQSYEFVKDVLDEVVELFPSEYVHLGGDEVPKDRWCNCKLCRERMAELKINDYDELQTYMVEVFRKYLEEKGKKVICWNDGITRDANSEIISQVWKPLKKRGAPRQTRQGRKVIVSPFFYTYFGFPYAMTPLNKTLALNPYKGIKQTDRSNVMGIEGAIWTEYIDSVDKLFFHLLPRLDALAELAWANNKVGFYKRLKPRLERYEQLGVTYNRKATRAPVRRLATTRKFFRRSSDVEFSKNSKN